MCCSQQPSPRLWPLQQPTGRPRGTQAPRNPTCSYMTIFFAGCLWFAPRTRLWATAVAGDPTQCQQLAPAWAPKSSAQPQARIVITSATPQAPCLRCVREQILLGTIHNSGTTNIFTWQAHIYTPSKQPRCLSVSITKSSQLYHTSGGFLLYRKVYNRREHSAWLQDPPDKNLPQNKLRSHLKMIVHKPWPKKASSFLSSSAPSSLWGLKVSFPLSEEGQTRKVSELHGHLWGSSTHPAHTSKQGQEFSKAFYFKTHTFGNVISFVRRLFVTVVLILLLSVFGSSPASAQAIFMISDICLKSF